MVFARCMVRFAPDHYKTLGVARHADKAAIKRAYLNLAKTAHPDAGGDAEKFQTVRGTLSGL